MVPDGKPPGLELRPGDGPDLSEAALDALIRHPNFDRALLAMAASAVQHYRGSWVLNRLLSDRGRVISAFMALDLQHGAADRSGFTLAQFKEEAARHGFASPGRVMAWAAAMRLMGYLVPGESGRPQRLVPTRKFFAMFRERAELNWPPMALIHPPVQRAIALAGDDTFLAHFAAGLMGLYRRGQRVLDGTPDLAAIAEREAGICILFSILLRDAAGEAIIIGHLARDFSVSRAHIRSILRSAQTSGMMRVEADGEYRLDPRFRVRISRFVAALFQAHFFAVDRALAIHAVRQAEADPIDIPVVPPVPTGGAIRPRMLL